jgi:guanine deaminase
MLDLPTLYYGAVVNPVDLTTFQALPRCLLAVGADGDIAWLVEDVEEFSLQETMAARGCEGSDVVAMKLGEFLLPGFIDTHTVSRAK